MTEVREFASFPTTMARVSAEGRTLKGYASAFDHPIESEATGMPFVTFIKPGAFKKTLAEQRGQIQVLFNHGFDPQIGEKPLGVPSVLEEDAYGLRVEVPLDDTSYNADIMASLTSGALRAMSIAFATTQADYNDDRTERYIRQARLFEFGPVTFPANTAATASLHSAASWATALHHGVGVDSDEQAEPSGDEDRASILDLDRLTWTTGATARQDAVEREQAALAGWLERLGG